MLAFCEQCQPQPCPIRWASRKTTTTKYRFNVYTLKCKCLFHKDRFLVLFFSCYTLPLSLQSLNVIRSSIIHLYLYRRVCVCVCVYPSGRIHVAACCRIGTKFGTRMQIHLEMVMCEIKITPCDLGGIWGVLGVRKYKIWNNYQTDGSIGTKFGTHVRIHLGMDIG